jgi:hypothetical protein
MRKLIRNGKNRKISEHLRSMVKAYISYLNSRKGLKESCDRFSATRHRNKKISDRLRQQGHSFKRIVIKKSQ